MPLCRFHEKKLTFSSEQSECFRIFRSLKRPRLFWEWLASLRRQIVERHERLPTWRCDGTKCTGTATGLTSCIFRNVRHWFYTGALSNAKKRLWPDTEMISTFKHFFCFLFLLDRKKDGRRQREGTEAHLPTTYLWFHCVKVSHWFWPQILEAIVMDFLCREGGVNTYQRSLRAGIELPGTQTQTANQLNKLMCMCWVYLSRLRVDTDACPFLSDPHFPLFRAAHSVCFAGNHNKLKSA